MYDRSEDIRRRPGGRQLGFGDDRARSVIIRVRRPVDETYLVQRAERERERERERETSVLFCCYKQRAIPFAAAVVPSESVVATVTTSEVVTSSTALTAVDSDSVVLVGSTATKQLRKSSISRNRNSTTSALHLEIRIRLCADFLSSVLLVQTHIG